MEFKNLPANVELMVSGLYGSSKPKIHMVKVDVNKYPIETLCKSNVIAFDPLSQWEGLDICKRCAKVYNKQFLTT
jgi:hypothetical protein